ncbi:MAG: beta-lactamase family protein [Actinomycetota bacterium]|nr:beta-lactamase family protein [Actinomycetota bacterium]
MGALPRDRRLAAAVWRRLACVLVLLASVAACSRSIAPRRPSALERDLSAVEADSKLAARVDQAAETILARNRLSGFSIAVSKNGRLLLAKGYGFADLRDRRPATARTAYRVGSVGKQFTAAAVLKLAHSGSLSLDDEITRFLPDFPPRLGGVTVRNLLTHTSGIAEYTRISQFAHNYGVDMTREEVVDLVLSRPPDFPPGSRHQYNNSGYLLAGLIVERASGRTFRDYLHQEVLRPAGLEQTRYCEEESPPEGDAVGYIPQTGLWPRAARLGRLPSLAEAPAVNMRIVFSAGAICSNVTELLRWNQALRSDRVVPGAYGQMSDPVDVPGRVPVSYGMGLEMRRAGSHPAVGHGGVINGFISQLNYFPRDELDVAFLANTQPPGLEDALEVWTTLLTAIFDEPIRSWGAFESQPPAGG